MSAYCRPATVLDNRAMKGNWIYSLDGGKLSSIWWGRAVRRNNWGFVRACAKKAQRGKRVETRVQDPQGEKLADENGKVVDKCLN